MESTDKNPSAADQPNVSLTGSGSEQVKVRANVAVLGLAVGDEATFPRSDEEVRANLVNGNLSQVGE